MIFEMDDRAKSWIESKGKHLTVNSVEVKGCCAVGIQDLLAIPKKPKDLMILLCSLLWARRKIAMARRHVLF